MSLFIFKQLINKRIFDTISYHGAGVTGLTGFSPDGEFEPLLRYSSLAEEEEDPYWLAQSSKEKAGSMPLSSILAVFRLHTLAE